MENQKQEALDVAEQLENGFITLGKTARALRYEAAETIRHLHARVEELEAMLDALGAGGVSAQRVTQGKDHIAQDRNMVSAPVVLPDGWKIVPVEPTPPMVEAGATERITPHITAGHGAIAAFKAMQQCVSCGHMYHAPAPSRCDCLENEEGKYLDFVAIPAAVAQADARDAQRYRWLIDYFISDRVDLDDAIVAAKTSEDIAKIIDAAIAAAKEHK